MADISKINNGTTTYDIKDETARTYPTDLTNNFVHKAGAETITGAKTFSGAITSNSSVKGSGFAEASMRSDTTFSIGTLTWTLTSDGKTAYASFTAPQTGYIKLTLKDSATSLMFKLSDTSYESAFATAQSSEFAYSVIVCSVIQGNNYVVAIQSSTSVSSASELTDKFHSAVGYYAKANS